MIIEFSSFLLIIKSFNLSLNLNVKNNLLQPVYSVHISVMYSEYVCTKILSVYKKIRVRSYLLYIHRIFIYVDLKMGADS